MDEERVSSLGNLLEQTAGDETAPSPILLQMYQAEQRKAERLWALVTLSTSLTSTLSLTLLVENALRLALDFSSHDEGSLMLLTADERSLRIRAVVGGDLDRLGARVPLTRDGVASWVMKNREPVYLEGTGEALPDVKRPYRKDIPSSVSLPLVTPQGRCMGVLSLNSTKQAIHLLSDEIAVLQAMANVVAIAIENAELYESLLEKEQQLEASAEQLTNAQMEERRRVAYDIHDGLAQMLIATHLRLQIYTSMRSLRSPDARQELAQVQALVKRSIDETRRVIADLRPSALDDFGLETALRRFLEETSADMAWQVDFRCEIGEERLPGYIEAAVYRIVQEAVTNARKHSQSPSLSVSLKRRNGMLHAVVEDRGKGFDAHKLDQSAGPGQRVGIVSMSERAKALGGQLIVKTKHNKGTRVSLQLPLDRGQHSPQGAKS